MIQKKPQHTYAMNLYSKTFFLILFSATCLLAKEQEHFTQIKNILISEKTKKFERINKYLKENKLKKPNLKNIFSLQDTKDNKGLIDYFFDGLNNKNSSEENHRLFKALLKYNAKSHQDKLPIDKLRSCDKRQLLLAAGKLNNQEIAKKLLDSKVDISDLDTSSEDDPLLSEAIRENFHLNFIRFLLENGANANGDPKCPGDPLTTAVEKQNIEAVELLLENDANPNGDSKYPGEPLAMACYQNNPTIIQLLLDKGANTLENTQDADELLYQAIEEGKTEGVELLLKYKTNPDGNPDEDICPLVAAIKEQNIKAVELLLKYKANPNGNSKNLGHPLATACYLNNPTIIQLLLDKGANTLENVKDAPRLLIKAIEKGKTEGAKLLLKYKTNPDGNPDNPGEALAMACYLNNRTIIGLLLQKCKIKTLKNVKTADDLLYEAIEKENSKGVELLLQNGANPNGNPTYFGQHLGDSKYLGWPLVTAIKKQNIKTIELLLQNGANPDGNPTYSGLPLAMACYLNNPTIIKLLLQECKIKTLEKSKTAYDLLYQAIQENNLKGAKLLLQNGANPDGDPNNPGKPLAMACYLNNPTITKLLLQECKIKTLEKSKAAYDLLYQAIQENNLKGAKLLLQNGANPDGGATCFGWPLRTAIEKQNIKAIELLLKYKAKPNGDPDNPGEPLRLARELNNQNIIKLLQKRGAKTLENTEDTKPDVNLNNPGNNTKQNYDNPLKPQQTQQDKELGLHGNNNPQGNTDNQDIVRNNSKPYGHASNPVQNNHQTNNLVTLTFILVPIACALSLFILYKTGNQKTNWCKPTIPTLKTNNTTR